MAIPFDIGEYVKDFEVAGATPDGADSRLWTPGHNGRILSGWAGYDTKPSADTATVVFEIGTTDAITWTFTSADTNKSQKAGTLSTTDTDLYFDSDDVLHLDVTSANKSEAGLFVSLLIQGR